MGIVPGPNEPSKEQLNHFLGPLVDDFVIFWETGITYSETPAHPNGRNVSAVLIPLIADLPAIKQAAGLSSYTSAFFCSFCWATKEQMNDVDQSWERRTSKKHRKEADEWLRASSIANRDYLFSLSGIRHSELLRLPYWDPVNFLTIDSMHAFFLGNFKRHCQGIWGFDVKFTDGDGLSIVQDTPPHGLESDDLDLAIQKLRTATKSQLFRLHCSTLFGLCREKDCLPPERDWNRKKALVKALVKWVRGLMTIRIDALLILP